MVTLNDLDKRLGKMEKKIDLISKAQEKFYPDFAKLLKDLVKSYNALNETVKNVTNVAGVFGNIFEDNKETITQVANQLAEQSKMVSKNASKVEEQPLNTDEIGL